MEAKTTRRQLVHYDDQREIHNHLLNVTQRVKSPHSGIFYVEYKDEWDDEKVGQKFGFSGSQIKDFRKKHVGIENPGQPGKPHSRMAMLKRIEALEARVGLLEDIIGETFSAEQQQQANARQQQANGPQPF